MRTGGNWRRRSSKNIPPPVWRSFPLPHPGLRQDPGQGRPPVRQRETRLPCVHEILLWDTSIRFIRLTCPIARGRCTCISRTVPTRMGSAGRLSGLSRESFGSLAPRYSERWTICVRPDSWKRGTAGGRMAGGLQTFIKSYRPHFETAYFPPRGKYAVLLRLGPSHDATPRRENFRILRQKKEQLKGLGSQANGPVPWAMKKRWRP